MPFNWPAKDPDEVYDYEHDWTNRLLVNGANVGDSILTSTNPDPAKVPRCDVTEGDVIVDAILSVGIVPKIQYWLRGGTIKSKLTLTVWTVQGRKYQESIILPIKPR